MQVTLHFFVCFLSFFTSDHILWTSQCIKKENMWNVTFNINLLLADWYDTFFHSVIPRTGRESPDGFLSTNIKLTMRSLYHNCYICRNTIPVSEVHYDSFDVKLPLFIGSLVLDHLDPTIVESLWHLDDRNFNSSGLVCDCQFMLHYHGNPFKCLYSFICCLLVLHLFCLVISIYFLTNYVIHVNFHNMYHLN